MEIRVVSGPRQGSREFFLARRDFLFAGRPSRMNNTAPKFMMLARAIGVSALSREHRKPIGMVLSFLLAGAAHRHWGGPALYVYDQERAA